MMSSLGLNGLPVFQAGHWLWQRPHSVHVVKSSHAFQLKSSIRPAPNESVSGSAVSMVNGRPPDIIGLSAPSATPPSASRLKKMLGNEENRCQATPQLRLLPTRNRNRLPDSSLISANTATRVGLAGSSLATCIVKKSEPGLLW